MAVIGQRINHAEENLATPARAGLRSGTARHPPGGTLPTIARTYRTAEHPAETADIVIPVERHSLVYEVPVG